MKRLLGKMRGAVMQIFMQILIFSYFHIRTKSYKHAFWYILWGRLNNVVLITYLIHKVNNNYLTYYPSKKKKRKIFSDVIWKWKMYYTVSENDISNKVSLSVKQALCSLSAIILSLRLKTTLHLKSWMIPNLRPKTRMSSLLTTW